MNENGSDNKKKLHQGEDHETVNPGDDVDDLFPATPLPFEQKRRP